jgi:hypothetical protein
MPYIIKRNGNKFSVINAQTGRIHAYSTTKANAIKQIHLLQGVEHGMTPKKYRHLHY